MFGLAPAPEFSEDGIQWFNVDRPLCLRDLRGRLVVLDFWTACCVNCLHVLPTLRRLQETFSDNIAIIGIHSPKYPAEQAAESVANAILRHDIRHPVAHDPDLRLWRAYGIAAWPTLVFIDPAGHILGDMPGEPAEERLITGIGEMIRHWRGAGRLQPRPLPLCPRPAEQRRFSFPCKIKPWRPPGEHAPCWALADSGHNQVVLCDDSGREIRRYGCGEPGFLDLDSERCAFNSPQGLACDDTHIYVADTGNHAIRAIDIGSGLVTTLAGSGERGRILSGPSPGREAALASVWDLDCRDGRLFFANAGTHQIGALDLATGTVTPLAGSGSEDLVDGLGMRAELAQPTGVTLDPATATLYFVDSESSSVRALRTDDRNRVETLVGAGLFECGRRNGDFANARLQHCRGLSWWRNGLVVADSYNGLLRVLDFRTRTVSELGGEDCHWNNGVRLNGGEPAGVCADGDNRLLVVDTNHHRIVELLVGGSETQARIWAE